MSLVERVYTGEPVEVTARRTASSGRCIEVAVRCWPAWVVLNVAVFGVALRRQVEVIDDPCDRCVSVFRLDAPQRRALVDAGYRHAGWLAFVSTGLGAGGFYGRALYGDASVTSLITY